MISFKAEMIIASIELETYGKLSFSVWLLLFSNSTGFKKM